MPLDSAPARRNRTTGRLNALKVAKLKDPGLYEDGGGLRLVVTDKGVKRWALRVTVNRRRVERGLGMWPGVSLEEARRKASEARAAAKDGRDLRAEARSGMRQRAVTFEAAFDAFFETRRQKLANGKHVLQWEATMRTYVFPLIGRRPVADVTSAEVLAVLQSIWFSKPETASRVLQRMRAVFDSAILRGTRERANPCIGVAMELGTGHRRVKHHAAIPWKDVPTFVRDLRLRQTHAATRLLFEFLILTIARSGEARGALWQEIDLKNRVWTIPGNHSLTGRRMKSGQEHAVPLSGRVISILRESRSLHDGLVVFPGANGQPLSDNTLSKLMRDAGEYGTPHGFRSAFKDWAAETGVRDEVSEAALAHVDRNRVRAAYRRTTFLDERRVVMERWTTFVSSGTDRG